MKDCKLHSKIRRGLPLSDEEIKLLGEIIREELKFLLRNKILPTPKNYERWFTIFCLVYEERGKPPSDEELIELYQTLYVSEKISDVRLDVEVTLEVLSRIVQDFREVVKEHGDYTSKKEEELSCIKESLSQEELAGLLSELIKHIRDIKSQNEKFLKRIEEQQLVIQDLKAKVERAELEANIDHLTNVFNRRSFERALKEAFEEYKKRGSIFSLLLIDLDHFKNINDLYGHSVGDLVLRRVAYVLRQHLRAKDILARWGGDEFTVIMPGTEREQATRVGERLKQAVEKLEIVVEGKVLKVSISYGVVQTEDRHASAEEMVKEADKLMYEYKRRKAS
ncbi:MAG: GGDEF domain-containing protein [Aquificaceae bacterium]|nr:GGDEF domain-containing protein [Aquificaceae bacterium]MCS7196508.1 GGDEF domain-containing protein [Aquificaceae bacterium]MCX7989529.1 GGDEF domain-containing protein [Aquificaceae bacterium]MDW8032693.1 GGDEF domain-containing protein [Aquificaceae bacterium]MDW8294501.1 GGDEF domain-containing protein [Aquificaceae bacterium]